MTEKNKGGRPTIVLTDEQKKMVEHLAPYVKAEMIADSLGIGRNTFFKIVKRDPEVAILYKKGLASAVKDVSESLIEAARNGNITAMIFYLKTRGGFKETSRHEHTAPEGIAMLTETIDKKADELDAEEYMNLYGEKLDDQPIPDFDEPLDEPESPADESGDGAE